MATIAGEVKTHLAPIYVSPKFAGRIGNVDNLCSDLETGAGAPPGVVYVSPPDGHAISPYVPVIFRVTATAPLLAVIVKVTFAGRPDAGWDFVFDGSSFGPFYVGADNVRVVIAGGYQFTVLRDGGWLGATQFEVRAIAENGEETIA